MWQCSARVARDAGREGVVATAGEPTSRSRILIVEDEGLIALEASLTLEDMGHEVCGIAAASDRALAIAEAERPDLALVDIQLRDGPTGLDLVGKMHARFGLPSLLVTAHPDWLRVSVDGAIGCLAKPYTQHRLRAAIDAVLGLLQRGDMSQPLPAGLLLAPWVMTLVRERVSR